MGDYRKRRGDEAHFCFYIPTTLFALMKSKAFTASSLPAGIDVFARRRDSTHTRDDYP